MMIIERETNWYTINLFFRSLKVDSVMPNPKSCENAIEKISTISGMYPSLLVTLYSVKYCFPYIKDNRPITKVKLNMYAEYLLVILEIASRFSSLYPLTKIGVMTAVIDNVAYVISVFIFCAIKYIAKLSEGINNDRRIRSNCAVESTSSADIVGIMPFLIITENECGLQHAFL